ncbi:hypothetical protein GEMRC1_005330 [Eukaryota sp. GEM-RC1]
MHNSQLMMNLIAYSLLFALVSSFSINRTFHLANDSVVFELSSDVIDVHLDCKTSTFVSIEIFFQPVTSAISNAFCVLNSNTIVHTERVPVHFEIGESSKILKFDIPSAFSIQLDVFTSIRTVPSSLQNLKVLLVDDTSVSIAISRFQSNLIESVVFDLVLVGTGCDEGHYPIKTLSNSLESSSSQHTSSAVSQLVRFDNAITLPLLESITFDQLEPIINSSFSSKVKFTKPSVHFTVESNLKSLSSKAIIFDGKGFRHYYNSDVHLSAAQQSVKIDFPTVFLRHPIILHSLSSFKSLSNQPLTYSVTDINFDGFVIKLDPDLNPFSTAELSVSFSAFDPSSFFLFFFLVSVILEFTPASPSCDVDAVAEKFQESCLKKVNSGPSSDGDDVEVFKSQRWIESLKKYVGFRELMPSFQRSTTERTLIKFLVIPIIFVICVIGFIVYQNRSFHSLNSLLLTVLFLSLEYFLIAAALIYSKWPSVISKSKKNNTNVVILIASYMSTGKSAVEYGKSVSKQKSNSEVLKAYSDYRDNLKADFKRSLLLACESVPSNNVYVCHNTGSLSPSKTDEIADVINAINHEYELNVNYAYIPVGNKTIALKWVLRHLVLPRDEIKYCVIMDDDVLIPANIDWKTDLMAADDDVAGAAFALRTDREEENKQRKVTKMMDNNDGDTRTLSRSLLTWCQDFEYLLASFLKLFQADFGTCICPSGALSIWKVDVLDHIFEHHDSQFHGMVDALTNYR